MHHGGGAEADGDVDADVAQGLPGRRHDLDVFGDVAGGETLEAHLLPLPPLTTGGVDVTKHRAPIGNADVGDGVEAGGHKPRHRAGEVRPQAEELAVAVHEADGVGGAPDAVELQQRQHHLAVAGGVEDSGQTPL